MWESVHDEIRGDRVWPLVFRNESASELKIWDIRGRGVRVKRGQGDIRH